MPLVRENSLKNKLIGLSAVPKNTPVTDDTNLFYWASKSCYPCSPVVAMNVDYVAVSWVPLQFESWFNAAVLGGPSVAPQRAPAPKSIGKQLQTLISLARHTSLSPTLEIRMMSAACSTWGSSWETIKCTNQLSSRWSYPGSARSSVSRKAQLHIWFIALRDSSVVSKVCFLGPLSGICLRPWCFSLASVKWPSREPRVRSTMWNARGLWGHLSQKTGICQTFFHEQTIPPKKCSCFKSVAMRICWTGVRWIGYGR